MHAIILFNEMKGEWYFYTLFLTLIKILAILMTSNRCNNSNRSILQQNNKKKESPGTKQHQLTICKILAISQFFHIEIYRFKNYDTII